MVTHEELLAEKINQLYHDFDARIYDDKHEDILVGEQKRWDIFFQKYWRNDFCNVLDYGCGTGFLSLHLLKFLSSADSQSSISLTCYDISTPMLDVCESKMGKNRATNTSDHHVTFVSDISQNSTTYDMIMLNSVLHHIPNTRVFFKQTASLLKRGGLLVIGHEPNRIFYKKGGLYALSKLVAYIKNPRLCIGDVLNFLHLKRLVNRLWSKKHSNLKKSQIDIIKKINDELLGEDLIDKALSQEEIYQYIDYHSPTASGRVTYERGIDGDSMKPQYRDYFEVVDYQTYDFLKMKKDNGITRCIDSVLRRIYGDRGSKFFLILRKK